ncbi:MAG: hypothetical protein ACI89D_000802 [Bermanella sp.]
MVVLNSSRQSKDLLRQGLAGLFLGLCILLSACSSMQPKLAPASESLRLAVPFVEQEVAHCGPAALSSALQFYGRKASLETLVSEVYIPRRKGSLTLEMTAASRRHNLLPYPVAASLDSLLVELDAGHPVLVLQNLGFNFWPQWHYALLVGYEQAGNTLLLHSGDMPYYELEAGTFMRTWARSEYWGLVLTLPDQIPAGAEAVTYLKILEQMRETRSLAADALLSALTQAAEHWPQSSATQFALANQLLASALYAQASDYFLRGIVLRPGSALAWNNLAYALKAQGCGATAKAAIDEALKQSPADERITASVDDIGDAGSNSIVDCPALPYVGL